MKSVRSLAAIATNSTLILLLLLVGGLSTLHAQSALDGFDPNVNGVIRVVVVQPDGKILIGGDFATLSPNGGPPVTRNRIARLNPDGTLDTAFNPNATGPGGPTINSIAIQPDGKILVGGTFTNIGGQPRNRIARLDPTTGLADSFNPNANGEIFAIALQADGKILVGGAFNGAGSIGGQSRNRIARLDATTGLADSLNPTANLSVRTIVVQADGKILVGGFFTGIGGQTRSGIARLDPTTGLADSFNPNANNGIVYAIAVQADGNVLAGGTFTNIGGQPRNRIARLDATTGLADSFDPNANDTVFSVAVQADGRILVGGFFTNSFGGQMRNRIARLNPTTGLADSFDPNADGTNGVLSIATQADGKVLVVGNFSALSPNGGPTVTRLCIARLETDGRVDQTMNFDIAGGFFVLATAIQPDGKILLGGNFSSILGVTRNGIARMNADGTLDIAFDPNANGSVNAIAVQADGKILVSGGFTIIGGQTRRHIARLNAASGMADSFDSDASGGVDAIAVQADGKVLAGGFFQTIGGQLRNNIARLDAITGAADSFDPNASFGVYSMALQADGKIVVGGGFNGTNSIGGATRNFIARIDAATGAADSFNPNANGYVNAVAVQLDGKILAGGDLTNIGGQPRNFIARLDPTTGLADSFNPNANLPVNSIAVQADGKILVGGVFSNIGGQPRSYIARLSSATGVADSFNPDANDNVDAIAIQADGKILVGGVFASINGQPRTNFARLSNSSAALQNLAVTPSVINWSRGGSSPQFTRVTFEYSTDNTTYTALGGGTPVGSNWSLTGLNLPSGTNFYIRARGYYGSGYSNGSQSIQESVRNVFLTAPLQLSTAVSRKMHGAAGPFDINILNANFGPECRSSGGAHTLVFAFTNGLVSGNASVTSGTGSVSGSPTFVGNTMTVNLSGVADVQKITVNLSGVTDSFAQVLPDSAVSMNLLAGDINGNKAVSTTDIAQVKALAGVPVDATNFRADVAANGAINTTDIALVKSRSGQTVP